MKTKRTLLDDFIKIYHNINCENDYCSCNKCSNKEICNRVSNAIKSIESR